MVSAMTFRRTHHAVGHHLPQRDYRRPSDGKQTYVHREIQPGRAKQNDNHQHLHQTLQSDENIKAAGGKYPAGYICKPPQSYRTRWADNMIPTVSPRSFLKKKKKKKKSLMYLMEKSRSSVPLSVCLACFRVCLLFQGSKSDSET